MIGDIVIISLAIASGWAAYKLFTMETKYSTLAFCLGLLLISFLIGGIIAPNRDLLNGLFSPEINGILIDSETNKPVPDVDVIVAWESYYGEFPYHSGTNHLKSIQVKSDSNGKFHAPSRYRSLAIMLFPLYNRENSYSGIKVFNLDYDVISKSITNDKTTVVKLKKISSYEQLQKKYEYFLLDERYGDSKSKELAKTYIANIDQHRNDYLKKYGIPKDVLDRIYGR